MDKFIIGVLWLFSILGAAMYAHEFAYEAGKRYERENNGYKFQNTKRAFAGVEK